MKTCTRCLILAIACNTSMMLFCSRASGQLFDVPWIGYDTAVYPEGLWPYASVTADFNGDGVPDLAASAWDGTPWFSVLMGDGMGGFEPPQLYPLQLVSQDLVAEDFDRDGDVDLAIAESGRRWEGIFVTLWYNDGAGGFVPAGFFSTGDDGPSGITSADFNSDGWMDVAVAHDEYIGVDNTISILLNDTNGRFEPGIVIQLASGTNDLEAGDTDGDGDADIVVAHEGNFWTLVQNNGNGSFQPIGTFPGIGAGAIPQDPTVHIADIDLDGDNDVFFSNLQSGGFGDGAIGLWRNDGQGGFPAAEEISLLTPLDPDTSGGIDINTADVTHDGWPDIIVCNGYWFLIEGDGTGDFLPPRLFHAGDGSIDSNVTDFDLDGDLDVIIIGYGSLEACVYLNPGQGEFVQPAPIPMADPIYAPAFPIHLRVDDIDDDGDLDLVSGYRSDFSNRHALTVRRNNGDGTFSAIEEYLESTYPLDMVLADMDNDGHEDLLYVLNGGRFYVRVNDGAGNFGPPLGRHTMGGAVNQLQAEDLDGDGDLDVITDAGFGIDVSLNNGGLNFNPPFNTGCDSFIDVMAFGDFSGNGTLDMLTNAGAQSYPAISFGNGNGTFGACFTVPTGRDVHAFDVADLDGDGNLDFVSYYNLDEMGLGVRRGRGDGNFFPGNNYPGGYYFGDHTSSVDLADFTGDGVLDAVTASFGGQDFSYWQGNGDGTFLDDVRFGVGWAAYDIEPGDFDGDGILDVAVMCQVDNGRWFYPGVVIIKGQGSPTVETALLTEFRVVTGTLLDGSLPDLVDSDDSYLHTRSGYDSTAIDMHHMQMRVTASTTLADPSSIDLTIEDRINVPPGKAQIWMRNWNSEALDLVGTYSIGTTEEARSINGIDATDYVGAAGEIEVSIKHIVNAPSVVFTFESFIDQIEVVVR